MKSKTILIPALAACVVVAATFIQIFPFSGHVLALAAIALFVAMDRGRDLAVWFAKIDRATVLRGTIVCVIVLALSDGFFAFVLPKLGVPSLNSSRFDALHGNFRLTLEWVAAVWIFIAPAEEVISRGFLIDRWSQVFGNRPVGSVVAVTLSAASFGLVHALHEGTVGAILNFFAGIVFGVLYLQQRRTLWACIVAHATSDTIALVAYFVGAVK